MQTALELDTQYLATNGVTYIDPWQFCDRVTRFVINDGMPLDEARPHVVALFNAEMGIENERDECQTYRPSI